jgi:hypothetical protein
MLKLAIMSAIFGAMLGNYLKIFVLPVVLLFGVTLITVMGIVELEPTHTIVGGCILFAVCVQLGYLAGALLQPFALRHTRAQPGYPKNETGPPPTAIRPRTPPHPSWSNPTQP